MRAPLALFALVVASPAFAFDVKPYDAKAVAAAQAAGKAVVIDVTAPWCPTCKAQHRVFDQLKGNPDLADLTIYEVDFDSEKDVLKALKVTSQSTVIAFNGTKETGRVAGETKADTLLWLLKGATYKQ
jgi:thiol-disulfide isomerase/thioredoxin